jgi:hypothetical protein
MNHSATIINLNMGQSLMFILIKLFN